MSAAMVPEGRRATALDAWMPPHSVEAEQAVLGGVMLDAKSWQAASDVLVSADFYRHDHQLIYDAISDLLGNSDPADAVTVSELLRDKGLLEQTGGLAYLANLVRDTPSAANVGAYAKIVRERSLLRGLIQYGNQVAAKAVDPEGMSPEDLLADAERKLVELRTPGGKTAEEWGEPVDLWRNYPAPSLRLEWLPQSLQGFVAEQCALTGTDAAIIGISAIVACASAIHDGYKLCPQQHNTTWKESARVWGAIVGDPSTKKSPGMARAISPLRKIDARIAREQEEAREAFEIATKVYDKEMSLYVSKRAKGESASPPEKPDRPLNIRLLVEDTTVEALSETLADNERGIMVYRDELSSWFGQMDAYNASGGASKDRGNWLEVYNGGPRRIDRIGRGNKVVPNWSACVLGGIQPDAVRRIASKLDQDGMTQRFMVVVGRTGARGEDRQPDLHSIHAYSELIETLHKMEPWDRNEDMSKEKIFRLSHGAQQICNNFSDFCHSLMSSGSVPRQMMSYLGKWDGLFARLLCAYHVIAYASQGMQPGPEVDEACARAVDGLMRNLLLPHGLIFYGEILEESDRTEHAKWIAGLILDRDMKTIRPSDVAAQYKRWRSLSEKDCSDAWRILKDCQWIRPDPDANVDKVTREAKRYLVNPSVGKLFTEQAALESKSRKAAVDQMTKRIEEHKNSLGRTQ